MQTEEKLKILVIDDEEEIRTYLKRALERRGYSVLTAGDGEEGLEKIKQFDIPIVFCDIVMPGISGIDFLKEVHNYSLSTQVIMVTGKSGLDNCIEAVEHGACGYLIKPVKIQDLLDLILIAKRNIIEKKEMLKKVIGQLPPEQVDDILKHVLKIRRDVSRQKAIIKKTLDKQKEDKG
jgi:DNA-binding NtrC family response regulator